MWGPSGNKQTPKYSADKVTSVLQVLAEHPNKHHNYIMRIVVEKRRLMAKRTYEKTIKSLTSDGRILSIMSGNKKYYVFPNENVDALNFMESKLRQSAFIRSHIHFLKQRYTTMSNLDRIERTMLLCELILKRLKSLLVLPSIFSLHKPHYEELEEEYRGYLQQVLQLIQAGPDNNVVFKVVVNKLLDIEPPFDLQAHPKIPSRTKHSVE